MQVVSRRMGKGCGGGVLALYSFLYNSSFVVFGTLTSLLVQLLTNHKNTPTETLRVVDIK